MLRPREEFLKRGSCVMCPEERRRRNIKTCCVSLEIAMADMMSFFFLLRGSFVSVFLWRGSCVSVFLWRGSCVSFSFAFLCVFIFYFLFFIFFKVQIQREPWETVWLRFSKPCGWTVIRTVPCFLDIDRFLSIKNRNCERFTVFPVGPYGPVRISKPCSSLEECPNVKFKVQFNC